MDHADLYCDLRRPNSRLRSNPDLAIRMNYQMLRGREAEKPLDFSPRPLNAQNATK